MYKYVKKKYLDKEEGNVTKNDCRKKKLQRFFKFKEPLLLKTDRNFKLLFLLLFSFFFALKMRSNRLLHEFKFSILSFNAFLANNFLSLITKDLIIYGFRIINYF